MTTQAAASALAAAAFAFALSGAASPAMAKEAKKTVQCFGINACKGLSACKTAESGCKGQNSCKGHGWLPAKSKEACEAQGGALG
ncbi:hypothetical protein [Methylocystis parvus]|uniref:DUF2282 domain-containing protein n=1 Tax=Methylocystis parvus TaxID=134 RepID=A0A6B8M735_9HYPH|nr:hypothetical protein [Methylocystis parvus]QGM97459.1 hypothetical protein F7D14_08270 [Methylocystis parvus]WBJ98622.1 hypothetical protein MMG94_11330 [Methylocystis parvus OBBP]